MLIKWIIFLNPKTRKNAQKNGISGISGISNINPINARMRLIWINKHIIYIRGFWWGFGRGFQVGFEGGMGAKKVCTVRGVWLCLRSESPEYNSI